MEPPTGTPDRGGVHLDLRTVTLQISQFKCNHFTKNSIYFTQTLTCLHAPPVAAAMLSRITCTRGQSLFRTTTLQTCAVIPRRARICFKAHRILYHSNLSSKMIKKKRIREETFQIPGFRAFSDPTSSLPPGSS